MSKQNINKSHSEKIIFTEEKVKEEIKFFEKVNVALQQIIGNDPEKKRVFLETTPVMPSDYADLFDELAKGVYRANKRSINICEQLVESMHQVDQLTQKLNSQQNEASVDAKVQ